ncbi:MAG TPA: M56 family metallopeptidase [Steroidobacteraceae bacterium]|nr:M56 family metallopeptidase [Steroidobacteraceae bacterium]
MNSSFLVAAADHLWQSTLFAVAAACLALFLRRNSARIRWFVWFAASAKFLLPFTLLTAAGAQFPRPSAVRHLAPVLLATAGQAAATITHVSAEPATAFGTTAHGAAFGQIILNVLELVWALGAVLVAARWFSRWRGLRRVLQQSTASPVNFDIPVRSSAVQLEPAVVGVLRPVLLLPEGLQQQLAPAELEAVLAHESCHVAWRDNLAASLHMLVEVLFWFHPLIWWLGKRMVDERERACDEWVLARGHAAGSYAEGILKVCEHYLQSPLSSAAGVGGGHLNRRIEVIMQNRLITRLSVVRKMVLTMAACAALAIPLAIGSLAAPYAAAATADASAVVLSHLTITKAPPPPRGQPSVPEGTYVALALKEDGHDQIHVVYSSLRAFVASAYGVGLTQVVGKDLSHEPIFDITADNPWPEKPTDTGAQRMALHQKVSDEMPLVQRNLLTTRFGIVVKRERRQLDGYVLTVSPGGSKLHPDSTATFVEQGMGQSDRELIATMEPTGVIVHVLETMFHLPVVDQTGLTGTYDYKLTWAPAAPGATPSPATMARGLEELGLHLERKPVTMDVIDVVSLKSPDQILASE